MLATVPECQGTGSRIKKTWVGRMILHGGQQKSRKKTRRGPDSKTRDYEVGTTFRPRMASQKALRRSNLGSVLNGEPGR